ncbi:hypothetical protein RFI_16787, partial [Reticulomyxa filosa]
WPKLGNEISKSFIQVVTQFLEHTPRTANQLGIFCSALLCNTDALHPEQVQLCFDTIRKWIGILQQDKFEPLNGLLPDSWCHEVFIEATHKILHQDDYQVVCVLLTFILHHAHLFQDGLRLSVIRDILIKENFRSLFCHWNPVVRKYFHWVILYTTNRVGFYDEEDLSQTPKQNKPEIVENAKKLKIIFNHIYQIVPKKEGNNKKDEKVVWKYTDMSMQQRLDTDNDIMTALAVEVINLNNHRDATSVQYRHYVTPAFHEFLDACDEYKEIQLSKKPHRLGDVGIPTLGYCVLTKQDLDEKDKIS